MRSRLLTIQTADSEAFEFNLQTNRVIAIGRVESNDIVILDPKVSKTHCRLELLDGVVRLSDCGSKNGVFVNEIKREEAELLDGDRVGIGSSVFEIAIVSRASEKDFTDKTVAFDTPVFASSPDNEAQAEEKGDEIEASSLSGLLLTGYSKWPLQSVKKIVAHVMERKIYLVAGCLFLIGGTLFVYAQRNAASDLASSSKTGTREPVKDGALVTEGNDNFVVEPSSRKQANQLAREAAGLSEIGKTEQAIVLYEKALTIDPENELAGADLARLAAKAEETARNCFEIGLRAYKFFDYTTAIQQWENVLYLLDDYKESNLYKETARMLEQAKSKASK